MCSEECEWEQKDVLWMNTLMNAPTSFETRTIKQRKSMHIQEELTKDLVTESTAIDKNNGINKPNIAATIDNINGINKLNSAATIVENEAVAEPVQANTTNINCTPHPTERHYVPVQANMTIINCTPHPAERRQSVQANPAIINCTPLPTERQQSVLV